MRFTKMYDELGKAFVHLDVNDIKLPEMEFDITDLLNFRIETYAVLKANASERNWRMVFDTTHNFIDLLTDEEKIDFTLTLIAMHLEIKKDIGRDEEVEGSVMINLETTLSKMLDSFDSRINLFPRLVNYTEKYIPIQSFAGVGERAQDSVEMTFYRDDVVKLTAAVLLCKMMAPIFGVFIESCKKKMDNAYKEVHCFAILKDILGKRCPELMAKLNHFIARIIKPMLAKIKLTHVYNGFTFNVIVLQITAAMFTRRFIAVDLFKPEGNLMIYVTSCARAAAQTQFSSTGFKTAVTEIIPPREQTEEDGNVSNLEAESRSSNKTADYPAITRMFIDIAIESFIAEHDLDRELVEAAQYYYGLNHLSMQPANAYLMCWLFGSYLGGAKTIEWLDINDLNRLIPVMQVYFIQQGYYDLVHISSAIDLMRVKEMMSASDIQLRATWNSSFEYKNCDSNFTFAVDNLRWDTSLKAIVDTFTSSVYGYNTAPVLWEAMKEDSKNGSVFTVSPELAKSICSFILHQTGEYVC